MAKAKPMTAQELIDFLQEGDTSRPIYFFSDDYEMADDRHTPFTLGDLDDSLDEQIDFNIPKMTL